MNSFKYSLKEIEKDIDIDIPFRVKDKNGHILINLLEDTGEKTIEIKLETKGNNLIIETSMEFKNCIGLLKYCIKEKLKDTIKSKEEIIQDILIGKSFCDGMLECPIRSIPTNIILIYGISDKDEMFNILLDKKIQCEEILVSLDKYIVVLVNDENMDKYLNSIRKIIDTNPNIDYYTSYGITKGVLDLKEKFDYLKGNINLCMKYKLKVKVYKENELILERALESISEVEKKKIYNDYNKKLSKLDDDLIKTIEVFLKEGLSVSNASEKLYIHRNTLFYRIDKIKKIVNYDITNFNEATEFKIIFNLWKANKNKEVI
ncbi:helix-turn-helix domain-containing protein [Clostridium gasigenes]|uniref:PucR family transcriptional regulator n=1 Tax=Clostridium gasigenes TaxID=94869 RepID=UPI001C0E64A6|nr:helix-turn-helix domain-containing protein [Clostridium gasigenes]MBU3133266.1 helix-turn-helix domain-containing protein [Clostridium gasigenes]